MRDMEEIIFEIISYSGSAKSLAYQAINEAENNEFEKAEKSLKESDEILIEAHKIQTELIHAEAREEKIPLSVLFIHAQDHLMAAIEIRTLSENLINLNRKIKKLEEKC